MRTVKSCLIIGAGMAGLTAAGVLRAGGWQVVLLDKGRRAGGRMATRRQGESRFDHGAQFFTVRDGRFAAAVRARESAGWVKPWFSQGDHVRYCGVEGMNGIMKELAKPLDLRIATTVERVEPTRRGWRAVTGSGDQLVADALLLTPPGPQSMKLISCCADQLPPGTSASVSAIAYDPCFALMATLRGPSRIPSPGFIRFDSGPIRFLADNTQKGISTGSAALTIHARADFTRTFFDAPHDEVAQLLLTAAQPWLETEPLNWQLHRWKYSQPVSEGSEPCLFTHEPAPLAFAGDGFGGPRVEGAFLSGLAAAERLLAAA